MSPSDSTECRPEVQRVSQLLQTLFEKGESFAISSSAMRMLVATVSAGLDDPDQPLDSTLDHLEEALPRFRAELLDVGRTHPIRCPNATSLPFVGVDDMRIVLIKLCPGHHITY